MKVPIAKVNHIKKKSKGTIRRIFEKLNSLNLGKYYFERIRPKPKKI